MFKQFCNIQFGLVLLLVLGFGYTTAYADCNGNACVNVKIKRLFVRSEAGISISTTGNETNLNCAGPGHTYIELRTSHPNYDEIYSLLLAAKLADYDVWIRTVTSTVNCRIQYVVLE